MGGHFVSCVGSDRVRMLRGAALAAFVLIAFAFSGADASAQAWLTAANQRIEQHRKADLTVAIVDSQGQPVPGADVHVEMKRHSFGFGTAVTAGWVNSNSANGTTYREKLLENFNHVVFENDLKWPPWEGQWGSGFNLTNTTNAMDWLDTNNLPIRGHYLSWATEDGGADYDGGDNDHSDLVARLLDHITDKATTIDNRVFEWDVINHPVGWTGSTYETELPQGTDIFKQIVDHARSVAPLGMPMWINEDDVIAGNSRANDYERIIEYMADNGSAPDGIGFQGHFIQEWGRVTSSSPEQVYNRIERFAAFGLPLRTTEFDIDVGSDEAWQGELMHDYLTVMFSHPDMEAITLWGFWGGAHWRGEAGALYETDWDEKPSLAAYQDLVLNQWWSDEAGTSDELGELAIRGFKGEYDITVSWGGEEYVLTGVALDEDGSVLVNLPISLTTPGDFNGDGVVDAADYTVWRDGQGTLPEFNAWKNNFGATLGSAAGSVVELTAVPEPSSTALMLAALLGLAAFQMSVRRCSASRYAARRSDAPQRTS